jgi:hypothetical protein
MKNVTGGHTVREDLYGQKRRHVVRYCGQTRRNGPGSAAIQPRHPKPGRHRRRHEDQNSDGESSRRRLGASAQSRPGRHAVEAVEGLGRAARGFDQGQSPAQEPERPDDRGDRQHPETRRPCGRRLARRLSEGVSAGVAPYRRGGADSGQGVHRRHPRQSADGADRAAEADRTAEAGAGRGGQNRAAEADPAADAGRAAEGGGKAFRLDEAAETGSPADRRNRSIRRRSRIMRPIRSRKRAFPTR